MTAVGSDCRERPAGAGAWRRALPRTLAAVLTAAVAMSCGAAVDTAWHEEPGGTRWRALDVATRGRAGFTMLGSTATGVVHRNDVDDEHALANRNLIIGAGVALGDVDGDGLADAFFASVETPAALYHNDGGFRFSDVTSTSGIVTAGLAITGVAFADVDGDGDLDLIAGTLGGPLKLWLNDGKGHFSDATAGSGLDSGFAATTMTLADVDGDGDLDLYVGTYKLRNALDAYTPQERSFEQVVRKSGSRYEVLPQWKKEYRIEDRPDLGGIVRSQRAERDLFYLNDGAGRFAAAPVAGARFRDEHGAPIAAEPDYFTLSARFYDFTGDGAPDLYVCNDFEDPDQVWINDGRGAFRLIARLAIRETSNTCMSVDFADLNHDGNVDLFTADMLSPTLAQRQRQIPTHSPLPKPVGLTPDRGQWMRNMLHVARGDGTFAQVADFAGVAATGWTWGSAFVDADLDGHDDLLAATGHRWDVRDADTFDRIRNTFPRVAWNREQGEFPRLATGNVGLRNRGDLTFEDVSRGWGLAADSAISHGIALADLDGDGDLDVTMSRLNAPPALYRNESAAPRVAVRLRGAGANRFGVGAVVTVRGTTVPLQAREMTAGGYYLSGSEPLLSFAAGSDTLISVQVRWRSGRVDSLKVRPNRLYEIAEGPARRTTDAPPVLAAASPRPLFENATARLGGHAHADAPFDDFRRQPLLPNRFSQLGPGVSWIDVDDDGRDDLVVGTGRGGSLVVLRNAGTRFTPLRVPGPAARWDLTTIVPVPGASGGTMLLAGQASYESTNADEALAVPSVVGLTLRAGAPAAPAQAMAPDTASTGPLALADVNGDGRLDLFVGARVIPGAWPMTAPSRLYLRAANGAWERDTTNARALRALGIVSAAVWSDLDGDGWPELLVASEWGPIRILQNSRGRLSDVTTARGLGETTSRWNGLSTGDFDGDGRLDIVATSWGRNTPWTASPSRPHELLVGRFGGTGVGLLFAQRDSLTGRSMPLESFSRLGVAIPLVRERIGTFAAYSGTSAEDVLGGMAATAIRVGATTYDHMLFLNRGARFEGVALPATAQLAPAFAPVIADFDGDGNEDLFLAQNFSSTEIGVPRFDAGAGLILLGDGRGGLKPLGVAQSGVAILGDQRGAAAADFDGDGRVDLAVSQNGAETTLWHNRGGAPGVRVRVEGGADNPLGIGAILRVERDPTGTSAVPARGAAREIRAGSAYWSMDAAITVLATGTGVRAIWIRWPGGREESMPIAPNQRQVTIKAGGEAGRTSSR